MLVQPAELVGGQLTLHNAVINVILQRRAQRRRAVIVKQVDTRNAQSVVVIHPGPDVCRLILQRQEEADLRKGAKGSKQGHGSWSLHSQRKGRSWGQRSHSGCAQPCIFKSSCLGLCRSFWQGPTQQLAEPDLGHSTDRQVAIDRWRIP